MIAPDNRGSGRALVPDDDGVRSSELFAADLLALIDGLGLERVHLVGQSMGGTIAQNFALAHPDRLRSLVIASCGPVGAREVAATDVWDDLEETAGGADADDDRRLMGLAFHPSMFERRRAAVDFFLEVRAAWPHSEEGWPLA